MAVVRFLRMCTLDGSITVYSRMLRIAFEGWRVVPLPLSLPCMLRIAFEGWRVEHLAPVMPSFIALLGTGRRVVGGAEVLPSWIVEEPARRELSSHKQRLDRKDLTQIWGPHFVLALLHPPYPTLQWDMYCFLTVSQARKRRPYALHVNLPLTFILDCLEPNWTYKTV